MRRPSALAAIALLILPSGHLAQEPVPRDLYQGGLRQSGNAITFCLWPDSPLYAADREIGTALADAMLLEPQFHDVEAGPSLHLSLEDELFVNLSDHCDLSMSTSLRWNPVPDWLTISRPYYDAPFVALARIDTYAALGEVPPARPIGSVVFTPGDTAFITFNQARAADQRWRRLPYPDYAALFAAVASGAVEAGIFWQPALAALGRLLADSGVAPIDLAPVPIASQPVGLAMLSGDTFVRTLADAAIDQLQSDGTLHSILERHGLH